MTKHCLLIIGLLIPTSAWPQAGNSTIRGIVRDQANAVIPGAKVTLTNTGTSVARESLTNEAGFYTFPAVTPGPYRLVVEHAGMQKFEGNLQVQTAQDASVDVALQIATGVVTVNVQEVTPMLHTDNPSLGHVLERQRIEQLPGVGRGYQNLLQTVPGVTWSGHGHGIGGRMQAYGLPTGSNMIVHDGAPINETYEGWDMPRTPDLDTLQELTVEVNNSSARYSRPTAVIMSTRSGTNQFHGSLFENFRNSGVGAARRRQDTFTKAPLDNRNEFGATAGGPVFIPKLYDGRNRTFFFFSWEGTRYARYSTSRLTVPTAAMKNGDFRGLVDAQGRQINIYDPYTTDPVTNRRQQFAYRGIPNTIDPARISPTAKFLFDLWLEPNLSSINPLIDANRVVPILRSLFQETYNTRIDHRFSQRDQLFVRYSYNVHKEQYQDGPGAFRKIGGMDVINRTSRWWPNNNASVSLLHTFSPSFTNEVLITGFRDWHQRGAGLDPARFGGETLTKTYADMLGIPNPLNAVNWPNFGGLGLGSAGGEQPYYLISSFFTIEDNATKVIGKHELQFGIQFRYEMTARNTPANASLSFDTLATSQYDSASNPTAPQALPQTGFGLANLFIGAGNYTATFGRPWVFMRKNDWAPYIQDTWRLTPRLTLNLGLRWDLRTPTFDHDNALQSFDLDKKAYVLSTSVDRFLAQGNTLPSIVTALRNLGGKIITHNEAGLNDRLQNFYWGNIGPRMGFAYRALDGKKAFVLRGGYRISSYPQPTTNWLGSQNGTQLTNGSFPYSVTNTTLSPDGLPNYGLRSVPKYIAGVNTPSSIININETRLLTRGSFDAVRLNPDLRDPRVHDWNLTFEKEVVANTVVRIGMVGNHTVNIQQSEALNNTTPAYIWYVTRRTPLPTGEFANVATRPFDQTVYGNITQYNSTAYEWYNGGQFELEKRFSRGVGFQVFYNVANVLRASGTVPTPANYLPNALSSDYDARNRFINYQRDTTAPQHQIRWNFIADLRFGKGKLLGGNAKGVVEKFIGGWQIAATGSWRTSYWTLPTDSGYTTGVPVEIYGYKYPIQDCTSGVCFPGYLWWNGYIPANRINSKDTQGRPNGYMGIPSNYKPAVAYLIPQGSTALPANAPANTVISQFWDTNNVWIPLSNGTVQRQSFDDGLHPWRNQYVAGPRQWFQDASLFKFIPITERVTFRFNIDFFNVFNNPNDPTSVAGSGFLSTRNSGSDARFLQLALRLTW
jgi:hypothetical protein